MELNYYIENKVAEEQFEKIVYDWLIDGEYTPDDIIENIITENKNRVYIPLYFFKKGYQGTCSAALGHPQEQVYSEYDPNTKQSVQKRKWVTVFRPHTQDVQGTVSIVTYAGIKNIDYMVGFVENVEWQKDDLQQFYYKDDKYETLVKLFSYSPEACWNNRGFQKANDLALKQAISMLPGNLVQNVSLNVEFTNKILFSLVAPFWVFIYDYSGKKYFVAVDGNNPSRIDGSKPQDKKRKNKVIRLRWFGWIAGIIASYFGVYLLSNQSVHNIKITWGNTGIFLAGLILIQILVETEINGIKNKSLRFRKKNLNARLSK